MNCPNCNTENADTAKFCIKCGSTLKQSVEIISSNNSLSEQLIIIGLSINFIAFSIQVLINNILQIPQNNNWTSNEWNKFSLFMNLIYFIGMILIPIALKNRTLKIIGIILVIITNGYWVVQQF